MIRFDKKSKKSFHKEFIKDFTKVKEFNKESLCIFLSDFFKKLKSMSKLLKISF